MNYILGGEITDNITMLIKKSRKSYDVDSNIGADNIDIDLEFDPPVSPPDAMLITIFTQILRISLTFVTFLYAKIYPESLEKQTRFRLYK